MQKLAIRRSFRFIALSSYSVFVVSCRGSTVSFSIPIILKYVYIFSEISTISFSVLSTPQGKSPVLTLTSARKIL